MNETEKKKIARRLSVRVSTGLSFVEFEYLNKHTAPDAAWIRNIYILLSFYTELLLKTIYIIKSGFRDVAELDKRLRKMGHNLETIGQKIGKNELLNFGIIKIECIKHEYFVETDQGNFYVKDFIDIRYDFLDDRVRVLNGNEHQIFKQQINIILKINNKLKPIIW